VIEGAVPVTLLPPELLFDPSDGVSYGDGITTVNPVVTFNANGGAGDDVEATAPDYTVTLPEEPTRANYTFVEWNTKDDGAGDTFTETTKVTKSITVYARWSDHPFYTVFFNSNGGSDVSPATASATYESDYKVTPPTPTREGHTFVEWNTKDDGTGDEFTASTPVSADLTVYAQWALIPPFTVTFDANGGSVSPTSATVTYPATTVVNLPTAPTRTGYNFTIWQDGNGTVFEADTSVTANITVYAQWTPKQTTITFNLNGGGGSQVETPTANYGAAMPAITLGVTTGTDPYYSFTGSFDATSGGTQYYTATGASARVWNKTTGSQILYAQWKMHYAIGDTGPAGGTICYVATTAEKASKGWDWFYLESSPQLSAIMAWGTKDSGVINATGNNTLNATPAKNITGNYLAIGTGPGNTAAIVAAHAAAGLTSPTSSAANYCDALVVNGYSDWFLPSYAEVKVKIENIGDIYRVWSSTQQGPDYARLPRIDSPTYYNEVLNLPFNNDNVKTRAMRRF
ncbi:MAG: InlB B-repeat-containing protein, partial [Spirochaetaceae bacterium]|jgi:uncharacterized repeat protein (TIGR02543 family)|nr:InlB B-repeat-containing protein [Spirochaetaceae bacterium]